MQALSDQPRLPSQYTLPATQTNAQASFDDILSATIVPTAEELAGTSGGLVPLQCINARLPLTPLHLQPSTQPHSLWRHFIDLHLLGYAPKIPEPIEAGRPDVRVLDATVTQVRRGEWREWEDVSACFRQCGFGLPPERRVMVPRGAALAFDIRAGLALLARTMSADLSLTQLFCNGHQREDALALMSLARIGLTEPHATRCLAHSLAEYGTEPPPHSGTEGISLAERLDLIQQLHEAPQFVGVGAARRKYPALSEGGSFLKQRNPDGETPLEIAIRCNNETMVNLLRDRLGEQPQAAAVAAPDIVLSKADLEPLGALPERGNAATLSQQTQPLRDSPAPQKQDSASLTSEPPPQPYRRGLRSNQAPERASPATRRKRLEPSPSDVITPRLEDDTQAVTKNPTHTRASRSRRRK